MDKIIERALSHWYAPEHELYGDPLPALMGIVGESGELCDLWKKKLYKPGYVFDRDEFLDELGDCLFYAAVLCEYTKIDLNYFTSATCDNILFSISIINYQAALLLRNRALDPGEVAIIIMHISSIARELDITPSQLSELNYAKLNERAANGEGYNKGVEKKEFVICNRADDCGIICPHKEKHQYSDIEDCNDVGCISSGLSDATCIPYTDN